MIRYMKKIPWRSSLLAAVILAVGVAGSSWFVGYVGQKEIVENWQAAPPSQVAIVLGARVYQSGNLSSVLKDRMDTAIDLYRSGKVRKLLLTGDHGQKEYDEVNNMRRYALEQGIPATDVFMDHAGFSTYDSMYRAKAIFGVTQAIIVTQKFHLPRSIYIAKGIGIKVIGVPADRYLYRNIEYMEGREALARIKAFLQTDILRSKPKYLGEAIPITGDGRATNDLPAESLPVVK